jgi:hypothetical protein
MPNVRPETVVVDHNEVVVPDVVKVVDCALTLLTKINVKKVKQTKELDI